jgi:hypothetical protein
MHKLIFKLWEQDPGFIRSKRAFKTVIACASAILLTLPFNDKVACIAAGAVAAFSLQGIPGATKKQQMAAMLKIGSLLVVGFTLANLVHPYPLATSMLLITISFLCFYLRRFGNMFNILAVSGWAVSFLGSIMPAATHWVALQHGLAAILGFATAFSVNFCLLPENRVPSFYDNLRTYFNHCAHHLQWLAEHIQPLAKTELIKRQMLNNLSDRRRLILVNQLIIETFSAPQRALLKKLNASFIGMYTTGKALSIINESCYQIALQGLQLSDEIKQQLATNFLYFAEFLRLIEIESSKQRVRLRRSPEDCYNYLQRFRKTVLACELNEEITYLLTIELGFKQLWHCLRKL